MQNKKFLFVYPIEGYQSSLSEDLRLTIRSLGYCTASCTYGELSSELSRENYSANDVLYLISLGYQLPDNALKYFHGVKIMLAGDDPQAFEKNAFGNIKKILLRKPSIFGKFRGNLINARSFDLIFTPDLKMYSRYLRKKFDVRYFPYWSRSCGETPKIESFRTYDLVSVMNLNSQRKIITNQLSQNPFITFKNWQGIPSTNIFSLYSSSKAVFNECSYGEVNIRYFEALGSGCNVFSNCGQHLEDLQELGIDKYVTEWDQKTNFKMIQPTGICNLDELSRTHLKKFIRERHSSESRARQLLSYV